jgi:hypothetical protein
MAFHFQLMLDIIANIRRKWWWYLIVVPSVASLRANVTLAVRTYSRQVINGLMPYTSSMTTVPASSTILIACLTDSREAS